MVMPPLRPMATASVAAQIRRACSPSSGLRAFHLEVSVVWFVPQGWAAVEQCSFYFCATHWLELLPLIGKQDPDFS
jgi:hypothetical protein